MLGNIDWSTTLSPGTPILEILIRGTVVYLFLFGVLRFVVRRDAGAMSVTDLLLVVLLADASQNAMGDDYRSIPDGVILVATITSWNYGLDWLGVQHPFIERIVHPPPTLLVREGRVNRRGMRSELLTMDELMTALRKRGLESVDQVKVARMEGDGTISVIPRGKKKMEGAEEARRLET